MIDRGKSFLIPVRTLIGCVEANWPDIQRSCELYDQNG